MPMIKTELTDYYTKRAAEFERIYQKPERQEDLRQLQGILADIFYGLDVLEIACGTGFWTQFASLSAKSIVATDNNEEVLSIAREKDYGCPITFLKKDAYALDDVGGSFSAAFAGFWLSHIPKAKIDGFLRILHSILAEGATVVMIDNLYVEGSSTQIAREDKDGNTYQIRELSDGSRHEVLKNFVKEEEFMTRIMPLGKECQFSSLEYFWLAQYKLNIYAEQGASSEARNS
jgi:demethylmenaquinone methyltransferase/2-methoxy-6-polyprenyl-1,4-benzoquinol methylase